MGLRKGDYFLIDHDKDDNQLILTPARVGMIKVTGEAEIEFITKNGESQLRGVTMGPNGEAILTNISYPAVMKNAEVVEMTEEELAEVNVTLNFDDVDASDDDDWDDDDEEE